MINGASHRQSGAAREAACVGMTVGCGRARLVDELVERVLPVGARLSENDLWSEGCGAQSHKGEIETAFAHTGVRRDCSRHWRGGAWREGGAWRKGADAPLRPQTAEESRQARRPSRCSPCSPAGGQPRRPQRCAASATQRYAASAVRCALCVARLLDVWCELGERLAVREDGGGAAAEEAAVPYSLQRTGTGGHKSAAKSPVWRAQQRAAAEQSDTSFSCEQSNSQTRHVKAEGRREATEGGTAFLARARRPRMAGMFSSSGAEA